MKIEYRLFMGIQYRFAMFKNLKKFMRGYNYLWKNNIFCITRRTFTINHQGENEHAHKVLLNHPAYSQTTCDSSILKFYQGDILREDKFCHKNVSKLIGVEISQLPTLSFAERENLFHSVLDDDLITIFINLLVLSNADNMKSYSSLYHILMNECIKRSKTYDVNKILLLADIWYNINSISVVSFKYYHYAVNNSFNQLHRLNVPQFVQSFFYLIMCKNFNFGVKQKYIDIKIGTIIDQITIEELGIISLGLFKTKNYIQNLETLEAFSKKIIENKKVVSDITLASLLKTLKKSFTGLNKHERLCSKVLDELRSEVKRMNNFHLMQLASIGNHLNFYNISLLNSIFDKFMNEINLARIKDIERHAFVLMNSTLSNPALLQMMEVELIKLSRQKEIETHPNAFLSGVYYLTSMKRFNENLVSQAIKLNASPRGNLKEYDRHLFELDQIMEIEYKKEYTGLRLSKSRLKSLAMKFLPRIPSWSDPSLTNLEKEFLEGQDVIYKMLRPECLKTTVVLPFSSIPDIIFCTDECGNLLKFPSDIFTYKPHELKPAPGNNLIWHIIFLANCKFFLRNTSNLRGIFERNVRLMEALGYDVITIPTSIFKNGSKLYGIKDIENVLKKYINNESLLRLKSMSLN